MSKILKDNYKGLINIFLGLCFIFLIIYRRFIIIRLPKELDFFLDNAVNISAVIPVIIGIVLSVIILYKNVGAVLNVTKKDTYFSRLSEKFLTFIETILHDVYGFITNLIPNAYDKLSYFSQKFYKHFKDISETVLLFTLFAIKIIILLLFLLDVFLYFRLNYMYKGLYLLGVSLIINLVLYLLKDFASNLSLAEEVLILENCGVDDNDGLPLTKYQLKQEYKHLELQYYVEQFILCSKVSGYLENYYFYSSFLTPRFNIFLYSIYFFGWTYVLFVNLYYNLF